MSIFKKDKVRDFLESHHLAVVATTGNTNKPSSSVVFYIIDNKQLIFITKENTQKAHNLQQNNNISATILDSTKPIEVTLHGTASRVDDESKRDKILQAIERLAQAELKDFAPIIKHHAGAFIAYEVTINDAFYTDYSQPIGAIEQEKNIYSE